jgi:hypothetical protein
VELNFDGCWSSPFVPIEPTDVDLTTEAGDLPVEFAPLRLLDLERENRDRLSLQIRKNT